MEVWLRMAVATSYGWKEENTVMNPVVGAHLWVNIKSGIPIQESLALHINYMAWTKQIIMLSKGLLFCMHMNVFLKLK